VVNSTIYHWHKIHDLKMIETSTSTQEKEISLFFDNNNISYMKRDRTVISPYELDFYIPTMKIGIEIHGIYWHMTPKLYESTDINPTTKESAQDIWNRDAIKEYKCNEQNIELITIWEDEWEDNKDYWKNLLQQKLSV
jgi:G:T-mismatch repair DNA endonuclease (very short patch repair protein)